MNQILILLSALLIHYAIGAHIEGRRLGKPTRDIRSTLFSVRQSRNITDTDEECPALLKEHPAGGSNSTDTGALINEQLARYLAAIEVEAPNDSEERRTCVGTFIAEDMLVTSASCFDLWEPSPGIGSITTDKIFVHPSRKIVNNKDDSDRRSLASLNIHPLFKFRSRTSYLFNIAVIQLEPFPKNITESDEEKAGRVPSLMKVFDRPDHQVAEGVVMRTAAFLSGAELGNLTQLDIPVTYMDRCEKAMYSGTVDDEFHICAGYGKRDCAICPGLHSSGGGYGAPFFNYDSDGSPVLFGVFSERFCFRNDNPPSLFTRIDPFIGNLIPSDELQLTDKAKFESVTLSLLEGNSRFPTWAIVIIALASLLAVLMISICFWRWRRTQSK